MIASVVLVLVAAPFAVSGELRLTVAHRFDLAPGGEIERIAGDQEITLVVVPIRATSESGRDEDRFRAAFLADSTADRVELTSIDLGQSVILPLREFTFVSASYDGTHVLFQDTRDPEASMGVLVRVETLETRTMPANVPYPTDIAGDWETESWQTSPGSCDGISPNARYITCFQNPKLATFLAGDWELQVRVYGDSDQVAPIYRGTGLRPWIGWSMDDSRLYFENEEGIWVAPVSDDLFG